MQNTTDESTFVLGALPWEEILELAKSDQFSEKFAHISTQTLNYIVDEGNQDKLIESAMGSLKTADPENANFVYATKLADIMRDFASRILKEREETSAKK